LLLFATPGCGRAHFEARHFFGTWRIAERTPSSASAGSGAAELVLRADGTFAATDVSADVLGSIRKLPDRLSSLTGTWTIDDRLGFDRLLLTIYTADQGVPVPYGVELMADGSPATPALYYDPGDPGQNQRVYLERTSPHSDTR